MSERETSAALAQHAAELHGASGSGPIARSRRRRAWRVVGWLTGMASIGVVFGLVIVAALRYVDGPAEARPAVLGQQASTTPTPPSAATGNLAGLFVQLSYPGTFDSIVQLKNDPQALEQYNLGSKNNYKHQIAVNVRPLASGQLSDDASYRLRQNQPDTYRPSSELVGGEAAIIMAKADGAEQTLFWAHAGRILTVSITSSDPKDDIAAMMKTIKTSARWRQ